MRNKAAIISRQFWIITVSAAILLSTTVGAQQLTVTAAIAVGKNPRRVAISGDGQKVYVANAGDNSISVIDIASNRVQSTIERAGKEPGSLVFSLDGRYLYVGNHGGDLSVIDTTTHVVETVVTGGPVRDVVLTTDGKRLFLAMEWNGLQVLDTATRQISRVSNVPCPEGLAIASDGRLLYVNYQCFGPGGRAGHDAIGVFDVATGRLVDAITGVPNVGGHIAISPDLTQLWINGNDACSQPAYDHEGCQNTPSAVVQVIRPSDHALLKSFGFSPEEGNGPISLSPQSGRAFIGGGFFAKVVDSTSFERLQSLHINGAGNAVFSPDGSRIYVPVDHQNLVVVLAQGEPVAREVALKVGAIRYSDLIERLRTGASPDGVARLMREQGLPLSAAFEADMRKAGVAEAVITAIADNMLLQITRIQLP